MGSVGTLRNEKKKKKTQLGRILAIPQIPFPQYLGSDSHFPLLAI